jgi:hypothetical protein
VGITRFWIWGLESRSVNIFSQRSDFGLLELFWTILVLSSRMNRRNIPQTDLSVGVLTELVKGP